MIELKTAVFLPKKISSYWENDIVQREYKSVYSQDQVNMADCIKSDEVALDSYIKECEALYQDKESVGFVPFYENYPLYLIDVEFASRLNVGDTISLTSDSFDPVFFDESYIEDNELIMYRLFIDTFIWKGGYQRLLIVGKRFSIGDRTLIFDVVII
ncbi:MAG: hypothetical protein AAGC65_07790 [Mucilaginibacter sp.]|uniref:hypothetical protein n=1 Tax=Mucilaginibacter sp. TaxID=1882438 RepID=UPI0031ADC334